jgi:hypothetical protein
LEKQPRRRSREKGVMAKTPEEEKELKKKLGEKTKV